MCHRLTGQLPDQWGTSFKQLTELSVQGNLITGELQSSGELPPVFHWLMRWGCVQAASRQAGLRCPAALPPLPCLIWRSRSSEAQFLRPLASGLGRPEVRSACAHACVRARARAHTHVLAACLPLCQHSTHGPLHAGADFLLQGSSVCGASLPEELGLCCVCSTPNSQCAAPQGHFLTACSSWPTCPCSASMLRQMARM